MRSTGDSFETALGEDSVPDPDGPAVSLAGAPVGDPPRAKSPRGGISWLLVSQLVLGLLVVSTTGMLVVQLRQQALTASSHEIQSLALTLADQAERAFDGVDLLQTTFMETVRADRIETPGQFRQRMSGSEVNQQLIAHARMLPQLDTIALIDADGMFINYNHALPVPSNSIADRSYFKALKPDSGPSMVVSEPIVNRMDQSLAVVVAHRITSTTGAFLGISFAGVRMNYFESLYQTVANKEDTAIALTRTDGVLFARYPHISATIGKSFMQAGIVAQMVDNRAASEVIRKVSQVDGVDRLIAGHTLSHFPLVVSVSASVSSILRPWREEAVYLIGSAAIMELMVVGVGLLMQRQLRSQRLLAEARAARAASDAAKTFAETAQRGAEAELALGQERERADRELRVQAVRFGAALGNMSEVVCLFDATDRLVVGNDRLASMLYLPAGSITPGMTITDMGDLLPETSGLPPTDPRNIHSLILRVKDTGDRGSQMLDTENGRIAVNFAPMAEDGWLVTLEDITEQRRSEAKIEHMAHHDALTGLANRVLFHIRLSEAMARCRRGEHFAVLYLDLDHFKAVNDTLGHPVGDTLLREVTQRLKLQVREIDTVARLGGDEFAIVQSIGQPSDSTALARRLIEAVGAPYEINGHRIIIGTSIGIAIVPADGADVDEIIINADLALYRSKADGRGRYQFFEPEMNARMQARRVLDLDLRKALAERRVRGFLSAADQHRHPFGLRVRGAVAVASSAARHGIARRFHSAGGGDRPDRSSRRMGAATGLR